MKQKKEKIKLTYSEWELFQHLLFVFFLNPESDDIYFTET